MDVQDSERDMEDVAIMMNDVWHTAFDVLGLQLYRLRFQGLKYVL